MSNYGNQSLTAQSVNSWAACHPQQPLSLSLSLLVLAAGAAVAAVAGLHSTLYNCPSKCRHNIGTCSKTQYPTVISHHAIISLPNKIDFICLIVLH